MFRSVPSPRALALALLAVAGRDLEAQRGVPSAPADTSLPVVVARPDYLRAISAAAPPVIIGQAPYRVLIAPAATAAVLDTIDFRDSLSRACPAEGVPPSPAYAPGGVAVDATKYFVVIAATASSAGEGCAATWNASAASIWSGLAVGVREAEALAPRALFLFANGIVVEPARSVWRPLLERHDGEWRRAGTQLRYYYPMSVLTTSRAGAPTQLAVQVWSSTNVPTSFDVSTADGERLRFAYAAWRVAMSPRGSQPVRLTPRRAVGPELRELLAAAAARPDSSALRAAELASIAPSSRLPEYERDVAAMLVADVLAQRGDTAAVRSLVAGIRLHRSCIAPPSGASRPLVAAVAAARPRNCSEHSALGTFGLGLVAPGGGHWLHENKVLGVLMTGVVSGIYASAFMQNSSAEKTYAKYQQSRLDTQAADLFAFATKQRSAARQRALVGVAISASDAVFAALLSAAQNREVRRGRL